MNEEIELARKNQVKFQDIISSKSSICVCTCGNCGDVMYYDTIVEGRSVLCPHCGYKGESSDFPDLFYTNWHEGLEEKTLDYYTWDQLGEKKINELEIIKNNLSIRVNEEIKKKHDLISNIINLQNKLRAGGI